MTSMKIVKTQRRVGKFSSLILHFYGRPRPRRFPNGKQQNTWRIVGSAESGGGDEYRPYPMVHGRRRNIQGPWPEIIIILLLLALTWCAHWWFMQYDGKFTYAVRAVRSHMISFIIIVIVSICVDKVRLGVL